MDTLSISRQTYCTLGAKTNDVRLIETRIKYQALTSYCSLEGMLNDEPLRRKMGEQARAKVLGRFDARKNSEQLVRMMKALALPEESR